ncbi:hypothetical protein AB1395_05480 [Streptococcus pluranimalium]|uniref:hypothetical protein n=1 Tax=Streptococcus pluranimalium TaxID=82348 RepID=UPI002A7C72D0|nr:hypothetical protein [Streptococcus pluranimalium]HEM6115500.1 hypothetical protein [Streptococcus suis]
MICSSCGCEYTEEDIKLEAKYDPEIDKYYDYDYDDKCASCFRMELSASLGTWEDLTEMDPHLLDD